MVNLKDLEKVIEQNHHYVSRFWDIDDADDQLKINMALLNRLKNDTFSEEDVKKANELISNPF